MGILRLILALCVVVAHTFPIFGNRFIGGELAVESFFIISGFYMAMILNEKYIGQNASFKLFITNRFLRIFPIYWVVFTISLTVFLFFGLVNKSPIPVLSSYSAVKANLFSFSYLILSNILLFGQDVILFLGINPRSGDLYFTSDYRTTSPPLYSFMLLQQAWTLSLELTFYIVASYIFKKGIKLVILLIALSLGLRFYLYNALALTHDPWTYRFFPTEILFFLIGYLSYKMFTFLKQKPISDSFCWFIFIFVLFLTFTYSYIPTVRISYLPLSVNQILYLGTIAISIPFIFKFSNRKKWNDTIGELSYPVYISHMLFISISKYWNLEVQHNAIVIGVVTLFFSYFLVRFIAKPLESYRQSRLAR